MKYVVRKSVIWLVGYIWMPMGVPCGQCLTLDGYDVENARDAEGKITRESVEQWLATNAGDFREITDFSASIEDNDQTVDIPWATEAGELAYADSTSGED